MAPDIKCGYGCGGSPTVDFVWPNDGDVWHLCARHADALQQMLDSQREPWAAKVVRRPFQGGDDDRDAADDAAPASGLRGHLRQVLRSWRQK